MLMILMVSSSSFSQVEDKDKYLYDLLILSNPNQKDKAKLFTEDIDGNRIVSSKRKVISIDTCSMVDKSQRKYSEIFSFIEEKFGKDNLFALDVTNVYADAGINNILSLGTEETSNYLSTLSVLDITINCLKNKKSAFSWSQNDIIVMPRYLYETFNMWFDKYSNVVPFTDSDLLHIISYDSLLKISNAIKQKEIDKKNKYNNFISNIKNISQDKVKNNEFTVGLSIGNKKYKPCTLSYGGDDGPRVIGHNLIMSDQHKRNNVKPHQFSNIYKTINDAFLAIKDKPDLCSYFIDYPQNIIKLHDALKKNNISSTYKDLKPIENSLKRFAIYQGYDSYADYYFADSIDLNKTQFKRLLTEKITTLEKYREIESKMLKSEYSTESGINNVLSYLDDRKIARSKGIDILKQRDSRLAEEKKQKEISDAKKAKEAAEARKRRKEQAARYAKEHPYKAVISCGMNGNHLNIMACFVGAGRYGADTQLEITNGSFYKLYPSHNVSRAGRETREGLVIDLKSNFQIKAQNSADNLILSVKIYDRLTNKLLFNKSAAKYGPIYIKN